MLLYICTCLVFSSVVKSAQVKHLEPINEKTNDAPKQSDAIFADVIKNISRVNNVLQELINNYEHLQKIYKSQENVESVYSDSEIDEVFKSKNVKKPKRAEDELTTKKTISEKFAATQMYWSDHDEDDDNSNDDDTEEVQNDKTIEKNETIEPKKDVATASKTTTQKPVTSEESSDESSDTSSLEDKVKKQSIVKKPVQIKNTNIAKSKQQLPQAEVIFVDTHRKPKNIPTQFKKEDKTKPKIEPPMKLFSVTTKPKTRYSKVSHNDVKQSELRQDLALKTKDNNTKKVKKIMYSESFSPKKIWNEIINNKPIQLEAHNEVTLRRVDTLKRNQTLDNRSKIGKTALVIIAKKKKKNNDPISSEDELTHKEELKTNVLRQAYGDACLKLVLRKCFKACKKVSRAACNRVKCRTAGRSSFRSYAKTGCIKEFNGGQERVTEKYPVNQYTNYRGQENSFVDLTRGGFLSAACLPHVDHNKEIALRNDTPANPEHNLNILRDRFERACKKISSDKCKNACNFAYTHMCDTNECSKRMKKVYKTQCKTQCKNAYQLYSRSDSDYSDSDSYDDDKSDDDSDDESD